MMIQVEVHLKCSLKFPWDQVLFDRNHESMGSHEVSGLPRWLSGKESASAGAQETRIQSLGWEDPLEMEYGNPLPYSCLGNPMDKGTRQATVHGVTKSWT